MSKSTVSRRSASLGRPLEPRLSTLLAAAVIILSLFLAAPAGADGSATPKVYGKTMGNWGGAWVQWAVNFTDPDNNGFSVGDIDCTAGQSGKVWFLAGTFGGRAKRTCSIPRGKALYVPLYNVSNWDTDCHGIVAGCRAASAGVIDGLRKWTCTVDGKPCVYNYQVVRAQSDPLTVHIPVGSIFANETNNRPGRHDTVIADGYALILEPLAPGKHTIQFSARAADGFSLNVVYHLTVK
jgi:hypothetical protein